MMFLKFVLAILPIVWLIAALSGLKMAGHKACAITLAITVLLGMFYKKMSAACAATAVLEGVLNALWPICLVIIAALFTYNLTLMTGAMDKIKKMLGNVSCDSRVLALIIGWGFGNFMEGMAGFGTAVAIPASMLAGIGLNPMSAVVGCLVVNSTPTAFGSVGVPTVTLSSITGIDILPLCTDIALIQMLLTALSPFFIVCICGKGLKSLKGMIPMTLIASLSFVIPQYLTAHFIGAELPNIIGAIVSMICMIAAAGKLGPKKDPEYEIEIRQESDEKITFKDGVIAWSPFILIFVLLMAVSDLCPPIHDFLAQFKSQVIVYAGEGGSTLTFSWINTPGVIIFIAAIIGGLIQKAKISQMLTILIDTLKAYWKTVLTICCVMSTAKILGYSGMISDIAQFLVVITGAAYPIISPLIGVVGGFVTGSGTSTCVLFGGLQKETALSLGLDSTWIASANIMGAGIGKMICPQSIAIGAGAINAVGSESVILGKVFKYCLFYTVIAGIICMAGTYFI
ncbi:MAG: L-lactate permease [Lachnospiraceae bacterium]|nr:L-lactate permease [Lachnospiraceae bacterium]